MKEFSCSIKESVLSITGRINVDSLGDIIKNNKAIFVKEITRVDCTNISQADSSCLAFLLYLQNIHSEVEHANIPKYLLLLLDLYDLNDVLNYKNG